VPYQTTDLCLLDVFSDKTRLEGTSYVEFHPRDLPAEFACWLDGSLFIRDAGFDFFAECFYKAIPGFDFFSFTKATGPGLVDLGVEIRSFIEACRCGEDRTSLFSRYSSLFSPDIWDDVPSGLLRASIINAGEVIESFRSRAESESGVLWILGM